MVFGIVWFLFPNAPKLFGNSSKYGHSSSKAKVLVVKTNDEKLKLIKIEKIDGNYFGEIKTRKGIEKIPLSENDIKTIRIKNKSASTLGNVFIVIGSLGVVFIVVAAIELQDFNVGFGEGL